MLVLSRKLKEKIVLGGDIEVTIMDIRGDRVKLGFSGPPEVAIHREEVYRRIREWADDQSSLATSSTPHNTTSLDPTGHQTPSSSAQL